MINGHRKNAKGNLSAEELLEQGILKAVVDTALSDDHEFTDVGPGSVLCGWRDRGKILVIAVIGATGPSTGGRDAVDEEDAVEIAVDLGEEKGWLRDSDGPPDYIVVVPDSDESKRERFVDLQQGEFYDVSGRNFSGDKNGDWWGSNYTQGGDYGGSTVELANFRTLKEMAEELESEHGIFYKVWGGGHGSYQIFWNVNKTPDEIVEVLNALEDYPSVNDDALSELEIELQDENWKDWAKRDWQRALEKKFGGDADGVSDNDLWQSFHDACEEANIYWESQSGTGSMYIDLERAIKKVDEPPPGFVEET